MTPYLDGRVRRPGAGRRALRAAPVLMGLVLAADLPAQITLDRAPIDYFKAPLENVVSELQRNMDTGAVQLRFDRRFGYLPSVLRQLGVPVSAQALVFSKTSFQARRISPDAPRAIYFNDDVYVGWVQGGDVLELSVADPRQGAVFYTLSQESVSRPRFVRQTHECLQCHSSALTKGVPGHLVRSVYPDMGGRPILRAGTFLTDHTSPLKDRWGGWYVTGNHGGQVHMGNLLVSDPARARRADKGAGANITDLTPWFQTSSYLSRHSDIVALMVLEHQTQMQNLITRADFLTRVALQDQRVLNEMCGDPPDRLRASTTRRIQAAIEPLLKYLLFVGEAPLTEPVQGTSSFASDFVKRGPRDRHGRSLRELDLKTRLFKYPLSYLIYSKPFESLSPPAKDQVCRRLAGVLNGSDTSADFQHISAEHRQTILDILTDTKPQLIAGLQTTKAAGTQSGIRDP